MKVPEEFVIDLQLFAEEGVEAADTDPQVYFEDESDLEDEAEEGEDEGETEGEEEDSLDEEAAEPSVESQQEVKFTKEQQDVINKVVAKRLARAETSFVKDLSQVAGTQLEQSEITDAAKLWGFLKLNPQLSLSVQQQIDFFSKNASPVTAEAQRDVDKELLLDLKEAVIDLKDKDAGFRKNYDAFVEWTEDNKYSISDKKTLEMAYLAWQGANSKILRANEVLREQRKNAQKSHMKRRASVEGGNKAPRKSNVDYTKMSDRDILASEGIALFTDE